jgi:hypothetical protein
MNPVTRCVVKKLAWDFAKTAVVMLAFVLFLAVVIGVPVGLFYLLASLTGEDTGWIYFICMALGAVILLGIYGYYDLIEKVRDLRAECERECRRF